MDFDVLEAENPIFGDEDEDLHKTLETARKFAHDPAPTRLQRVVSLALASRTESAADTDTNRYGQMEKNKVVFTEMKEFVVGIQLDKEQPSKHRHTDSHKDKGKNVLVYDQEREKEAGDLTELNNISKGKHVEAIQEWTIHEAPVAKGIGSSLAMIKARGYLNQSTESSIQNHQNYGTKEINIERRDEFGRVMTPKEAFRHQCHIFHGNKPGAKKTEKRMKAYEEEMKLKNSDISLQSMERMRQVQAQLQTPYLVFSGKVTQARPSSSTSGFATVEDLPGKLTPNVERFSGIIRKGDPGSSSNSGRQKRLKT